MKTIFGFPRTAVALVGIIVAIFLVVIVGMIIIGSAAIRALMAPGVKVEGVSLLALLVTIIVLLSAVFIMLLVLFWCCCRQMKGGRDHQLPPNAIAALLQFLPLLPQIRNMLRDAAIAHYAAGKTIQWMHTNITEAASRVYDVSNDADFAPNISVDVWTPTLNPPGFAKSEFNPLDVMVDNLRRVSSSLSVDNPIQVGATNVTVGDVATALIGAGKTLAKTADQLGASPPPAWAAELLQ